MTNIAAVAMIFAPSRFPATNTGASCSVITDLALLATDAQLPARPNGGRTAA